MPPDGGSADDSPAVGIATDGGGPAGGGAVGGAADGGGAVGVREVKSAARTVELLELLAARRNRPARLRELSEEMGTPRSSTYALLRTLVDRGWVRTDATGTLYSIGIQALLAGSTYLDADPILRIVQPQIRDLSSGLDETIHYGRLQGSDIVYLATHESSQDLRPFSRIGRRLPAFCTAMGKALLADAVPAELDRHLPAVLVALTPHTLTSPKALRLDLTRTRSRGYAVDREESRTGVSCFALALRFTGGTGTATSPSDAISCSVPTERLTDSREATIVEALRRTKHAIERMAPVSSPRDRP